MANTYEIPINYEIRFSCSVCDNALKESASFCPKCGSKADRSVLLKNLENEEIRISQIMERLKTERIELAREKQEKEQQIQNQIIQAQSKVKQIREQLNMGNEEVIPEYIKKSISQYDELAKLRMESDRLFTQKKSRLDRKNSKNSDEVEDLRKDYHKLLEKVEMSELFCPVCGTFTGRKKYCGKCGYLMRKGKTDAVSKV